MDFTGEERVFESGAEFGQIVGDRGVHRGEGDGQVFHRGGVPVLREYRRRQPLVKAGTKQRSLRAAGAVRLARFGYLISSCAGGGRRGAPFVFFDDWTAQNCW